MVTLETENGMFYEDYHPRCKCILGTLMYASNEGVDVAYIQCIDVNIDEEKRYWGLFDVEDVEGSIRKILKFGHKWPRLPV